jgi:hypothetical protein
MLYDFGEIFANKEDFLDWKDFCYHVAKDHTYREVSSKFLDKLDAFQAWRNQMKDEAPAEEKIDEIDPRKANVIPFEPKLALLTGGRGTGDGTWLMSLEEGAVFVSKQKKDISPLAEQWHVSIKWKKSVVLYSNFPHKGEVYILVDAKSFSEQNELIEILQERKQEIQYD